MSYKIQITDVAKADMGSIYRYIALTLQEPGIARKVYIRIKEAIFSLTEMPMRYPLYQDEPWHSRGLRKLSVGNYLVFYVADKDIDMVTVMRVMYARRDIHAQLDDLS